jgi:Tfp pilus assembly protein FimV
MTRFLESNTLTVILLIALVVASVLVLNHALQPTMDEIEWRETTYRVQTGDSLWAISADYCPDGVDRREWIDEIRALNDLPDSNIHAGQTLTVLVAVGEG